MSGPDTLAPPERPPELSPQNAALLDAVYAGETEEAERLIAGGADVNARHPETGLTPLHLAVGTDNLPITRYLVEQCGARFGPDRFGRWPTSIAAHCRARVSLCDYIVQQEAAAMADESRLDAPRLAHGE